MIPKIIHYCWFGRSPKPAIVEKCIESWKKFCLGFEIIEWNEDNFNIFDCSYANDAYKSKKWAYVSDYARFKILYDNGGIYLDTDVEVLKPLEPLLDNIMFSGFESNDKVAPGLIFGSEKKQDLIFDLINIYKEKSFAKDRETVVSLVTNTLIKKGLILDGQMQLIDRLIIYPIEYFCPKSYFTGKTTITDNTYTIHHYAGSWIPWYDKLEQIFWIGIGMENKYIISRTLRWIKKVF